MNTSRIGRTTAIALWGAGAALAVTTGCGHTIAPTSGFHVATPAVERDGWWATPIRAANTLTVPGDVLFAPGVSALGGHAPSILGGLAKGLPSDGVITIAGHTDDTGDSPLNDSLGAARSHAVAVELASLGIASARLREVSCGEAFPTTSNATASGRARNRRVVLITSGSALSRAAACRLPR